MEVGAPVSGLNSHLAKALTPRRKDLEAGTWAGDHSLARPYYSSRPVPQVGVPARV